MVILKSFITSRWMEKKRCRYIPFWFFTLRRSLAAKPLPVLFTDDFSVNKRINFTDAIRKKYSLKKACMAKKNLPNPLYSTTHGYARIWHYGALKEEDKAEKFLPYFLLEKRIYHHARICYTNLF